MTARTLFPSEDAAEGSGFTFLLIEFVALLLLSIRGLAADVEERGLSWVSASWVLLVAWIWISALGALFRFPAMVIAWEWTALGGLFLAFRQTAARFGPRPIAGAVVVIALLQCLQAGWQLSVEYPRLRFLYERRDPEFLDQMRAIGVQPGSVEEGRFRDRLYSSEPYGGFGHPNSLAGLLVLALPLMLAFWTSRARNSRAAVLFWSLAILGIAATLVISKSRSAWLGALVSLLLWFTLSYLEGRNLRRHLWIGAGAVALSGLLIVLFQAVGLLDHLVWSESFKSLSYRLEWWQGSLGVLREHPWRGVGFGNFASNYLAYKLPFSSEEIQDPHNFVLELACSAGIPALLAYLGALVGGLLELLGTSRETSNAVGEHNETSRGTSWWWMGVLLGFGLVFLLQPAGAVSGLGGGLVLLPLVVVFTASTTELLSPRLRRGIGCGVVGLHLHWLASGGVSFPGLALPCWLLLGGGSGFALRAVGDSQSAAVLRWGRGRKWGRAVVSAVAVGLFAQTMFLPAQRRDQILASVRTYDRASVGSVLERAARAMPGDPLGWNRLADWHLQRMRLFAQQGDRAAAVREYLAADEVLRQIVSLEPNRSGSHRRVGELHAEAARLGIDAKGWVKAVDAFRRTVECYPNSAARRWELAVALDAVGDGELAREEFKRSLELDATPHLDKKLTAEQRRIARQAVE